MTFESMALKVSALRCSGQSELSSKRAAARCGCAAVSVGFALCASILAGCTAEHYIEYALGVA